MKNLQKIFAPFLLVGFVFSFISCSAAGNEPIERVINNTQKHFAPDSRTALFEVTAKNENGSIILTGETNLPAAKSALLDSLSQRELKAVDHITVLPEDELGAETFGLINNSVGNIRDEPTHSAQLVTQATLGMPLEVLKKDGGWYLVQTPDDYLGWIDSGGIAQMNKETYDKWVSSDKVIYLDTFGSSYKETSSSSQKISDLVAGSILTLENSRDGFYEVRYPDGRTGYVSASEAQPFNRWKKTAATTQNNLVSTAKTLMGAPYLWGGTSSKGMDCSGFTKTIFFMNGWVIPRDASQQVRAGKAVDTSDGFENLRPGDLLFFGRPATEDRPQRVVHVGMWIGNNEFIHSSGRVRVSSVDPDASNYDEFNVNRFLEAKRYIDNKRGNILNVANMYQNFEQK